jgi:hypothetical protein
LVKAWLAADRPEYHIRLGSFERWSSVVGGIIQAAGIPGFLESLDELYDASDKEGQEWRAFADAWWRAFGAAPQKVADLNQFCEREGLMLDVRGDRSERSQQVRLGNALHSHRDQVYERYRIVKVEPPRQHRGTAMYALEVREANAVLSGMSGTCRGLEGEDPDTLNPIESIGSEEVSGTSGSLTGISKHGIQNHANSGGERNREETEEGGAENGPEIPTFSTESATHTSETASGVGILYAEVPTEIPTNPEIPTSRTRRIDLADFEEGR